MTENESLPFHADDFQRVPNQHGELFTSEKHPETFVRLFREDVNDEDVENLRLMEIDASTLGLAKHLYHELTDDYGIKTVEFNPALVPSTKSKTGHGVLVASNTVAGEILSIDEKVPENLKQPGKALVEKLTQYLLDKYRSGDHYLYDVFRIDQYALVDGEFVLFDVEPFIVDQDALIAADKKTDRQPMDMNLNWRDFMAETRLDDLGQMAQSVMEPDEFRKWQSDSRKLLKAPKVA